LKVIGAGFGRTGTLSLKGALEELGFGPCYHMIETFDREDDKEAWLDAAKGQPVNWKTLLSGYRSTVDWPGCAFYRQLMGVFPEAKVILTVRDPEAWYESVAQTINTRPGAQPPAPDDSLGVRMIRAVVWEGSLQGSFRDKARTIEIFEDHNQEVRESVPKDRLLEFEVKQGWEPLCDFLEVPVPRQPFPRLNERAVFNDPDAFAELVKERVSRPA